MAAGLHALMLAMMLSDPARIRADTWKFPGSNSAGNKTDVSALPADNNSSDISGRNAINININTNPGSFAPFPGRKPDAQININGFNPHPPPGFKPAHSFNPYPVPNTYNNFKGFPPQPGTFNNFNPNSGIDSLHRTQTSFQQPSQLKPSESANKFSSSQGETAGNSFGSSFSNENRFKNDFSATDNKFNRALGSGTSGKFGGGVNNFGGGGNFGGGANNFGGGPNNFGGGANNFGGFNPLPPQPPPRPVPPFIPPGFGAQCTCVAFYLCKAQDIVMNGPGLLDQRSSNKNISAIDDATDEANTTTVVAGSSSENNPPIFRSRRQAEGNETVDETTDLNETDISGRSFRPFPGPNVLPGGFPPQPPRPIGPPGGRPITQTPGCGPMQVCCRTSILPGPPPPGPNPRPIEPQCGVRNLNGVVGRVKNPNLVEGETQFGEFPWQGAVLRKDGKERMYVCGATLITPTHVLTAAHCVNNLLPVHLKVRLGEWDVSSTVELYPYLELNVAEIRINPLFYPGNLQNDIAVLRMDLPVDFAQFPHIAPVCLPPRFESFVGRRCLVTGWGKDAFGFEGEYQNILKQVDLPVLDNFDCENRLKHTRLGPQFRLLPGFMCAGGEPGKDACKGDGGSPLVCETERGYVAAGIVSWGIGCGHPNIPGVYVRVSDYLDWIQSATAF